MRRFWLLLILPLAVASILLTAPLERAAPQPPAEEPAQADEEPVAPEKLGRLTLTLNPGGHTAVVEKVFFTPDSKQLITLGLDHCIRIWDVATGDAVKTLYPPGFGGLSAAALAPDGKRLAVGSIYQEGEKLRHLIYLLTLPEGHIERFLDGHATKIKALSFSGDSKRLASSSEDGTICLWNPDQEKPERVERITKRALRGLHEKAEPAKEFVQPKKLALSPDGTLLAGLDKTKDGFILDLKPAKAKVVAKIGGTTHIAWSPDGETLATTSIGFGTFKLWSPKGELRRESKGKGYSWIPFSRDRRESPAVLVTWQIPNDHLHATLFEVATGKVLREYDPQGVLNAKGKYVPNRFIVSSASHDGALSPDGQYAATGGAGTSGHPVYLWKMADGVLDKEISARGWILPSKGAWSADGKVVAWDINHKTRTFHLGDLQFSRSIWKEKNQRAVWQQPDGDLSLKKDNKYGLVKVLKAGKPLARLDLGDSTVYATLVGKGKDQVAVVSKKVPNFWLFDAQTGKVLRRFAPIHANSLAPSPDGRFLLAVSHVEQSVRIYSVDREKPLLSLYVQGPDWVVWTPEGYYAATPGGERLMGWTVDNGIKEMRTFYPAERFHKELYRPDVIKLLLTTGNLKEALATANAALRKEGKKDIPEGIADPNKLLPPRASVEILDKSHLPRVKVKVSAKASVPNQPVTALRLLVDGRSLPGEGYIEFKKGKPEYDDTWEITLPGEKATGPYQFTVLARGPDTSSRSEVVTVPYIDQKKLPVMHVLAIGINQYKDKALVLKAARPDAEAIAANFVKCAKGELYQDVLPRTLLDKAAALPAILKELEALQDKKVKANDLVVVFFAGHGLKNKNGFYLLPAEADITNDKKIAQTCLSGTDLRKSLGDVPCQVLLMLDACHSAAFGKQKNGQKGKLAGFKPATDDLTRELTDDEVNVAVMCAAMGYEKAQEQGNRGLFTAAVVQALKGGPGVAFNRHDSMLYIHHLQAFVFDEVQAASKGEQHPFLGLSWVMESFPVVKFAKKRRWEGAERQGDEQKELPMRVSGSRGRHIASGLGEHARVGAALTLTCFLAVALLGPKAFAQGKGAPARWSGWSEVPGGGTTDVSPAATVFKGRLFLFGHGGGDKKYYVNILNGGNWSGWSEVPGGGTTDVTPAATVFKGRLFLFGHGIGNKRHYVNTYNGKNWSGWAEVPGDGTTDVSQTATVFKDRLVLFAHGIEDKKHYVNTYDGTNWSGWAEVPGDGTTDVSQTATVFKGRLLLFGHGGGDKRYYVNTYDGNTWSGWGQVPGDGTTDVAAAATVFKGRLFLFGHGIEDKRHYVNTYDGKTWSGWAEVPGGGTTDVSPAATVFEGRVYLFAHGGGDQKYYVNTGR